ncbi:MAG: hypothetical protein KDD84_03605, partial [Caldilineaceae bacterium]|nr:hypothetical protein [Caldilineaceae bacterium]
CRQHIRVRWSSLDSLPHESLDGVDLVLIDAFVDFESTVQMAAARLRIKSRMPLVMLTQAYSSEQLVLALRSGIDAILSYDTSPALLMAHCNALLRRWRTGLAAQHRM